jgi:LysR family transcriptional regulator of abg operon
MLAMVPLQFTDYPLAKGAVISIPMKERLAGPPIVLIRRSGLSLTPAAQYFVDLLQPQTP